MRISTLLAVLALFSHSFGALAEQTKTYQWGVYAPSSVDAGKIVIVDWNSPEGLKRLQRTRFKKDFYQLAHAFQPTANPVFATVASAVIVLNALRLPKHTVPSQPELEMTKPKALGGGTVIFPTYSQATFLNEATDKIKDRKLILLKNVTKENEDDKTQFNPGLGLEHVKAMLETVYKAKVALTLVEKYEDKGCERFRQDLKRVFAEETGFLISNFRGDVYGASNEGTMSPLAAYDPGSDSVLILDTGGHKNPWYWTPLKSLYRAMAVPYGGNFRGYLEVRDP